MGLRNPAPSRTATPQQLAQHARRLAEAADREASRLARAAPSDMPHAQTFFRSQSLSPGDGSDYLSPPSSLPTVAPVAANAAHLEHAATRRFQLPLQSFVLSEARNARAYLADGLVVTRARLRVSDESARTPRPRNNVKGDRRKTLLSCEGCAICAWCV
ncbi:hypothetical protein RI054_10g52360 [Pseudoscourfieldia marina]